MSYTGRHRATKEPLSFPPGTEYVTPPSRNTDPMQEADTNPDQSMLFQAQCPRCTGEVRYLWSCQTYIDPHDGQWKWCSGCHTAVEYYCAEKFNHTPRWVCDWFYVHGLDFRNPHSATNEHQRPMWIPIGQGTLDQEGYPWIAPGALLVRNMYA